MGSAGEDILPLADAKSHLRVQSDDFDGDIAYFRDAALDAVSQFTGKSLYPRAFEWRGAFADVVELGTELVTGITAIAYLDSAGAAQAMDPALVRLGVHGRIHPMPGQSWPGDVAAGEGVVTITFTAGYAPGDVPSALIAAAKLMIGTLFMQRETIVMSAIEAEFPGGFESLCRPYRLVRV